MLCVSMECWCTSLHLLNQRWASIYLLMGNIAKCIFCLQVPRSPNTSLMETSMCLTSQSSPKRSPLRLQSRSYTTDHTGHYDICVFTYLLCNSFILMSLLTCIKNGVQCCFGSDWLKWYQKQILKRHYCSKENKWILCINTQLGHIKWI